MKAKHDYDAPDFYKYVEQLAKMGFTDKELAEEAGLSHYTFSRMKNGTYDKWTDAENIRRSSRICRALTHGRMEINARARAAYLKVALGGYKLRSVTKEFVQSLQNGKPIESRVLHGMTERETEQPPNLNALSKWLIHHDPEWRNAERSRKAKYTDDHNPDIDLWMEKNTAQG